MERSPEQIAWAAGIFEGEGSIYLRKDSGGVTVVVGMTDKDVIDQLASLYPKGKCQSVRSKLMTKDGSRFYKTQHCWRLMHRDAVEEFLREVYPWLHERRRHKAQEAFARIEVMNAPKSKPTHCPYGHEYTEENTYWQAPHNTAVCRTCRNMRSRVRYHGAESAEQIHAPQS